MASKKLLTIFGGTGRQGGSVIEVALAHPTLAEKYAFRAISRDPSSSKSKALSSKGVEVAKADLNDTSSLKAAVEGSYGVLGVTDFWALMDKDKEIAQGRSIFEACKAAGVQHLVWSSLPYVEKLTGGELKHVKHFDSKAIVQEYVEANKGDMMVSYFMPAMFMEPLRGLIKNIQGKPTLALPFPDENTAWPLHSPGHDAGKYVMGLFEGGKEADGAIVNGVSTWTTPKQVVDAVSKVSGQEVVFQPVSADVFASFLPENIRLEILETQLLIGKYSYYGKGAEKKQAQSDKWLVDTNLLDWPTYVEDTKPWTF